MTIAGFCAEILTEGLGRSMSMRENMGGGMMMIMSTGISIGTRIIRITRTIRTRIRTRARGVVRMRRGTGIEGIIAGVI